eukprot:gene23155-60719_t
MRGNVSGWRACDGGRAVGGRTAATKRDEPILLDLGMYASACGLNATVDVPCAAQVGRVDFIFSLTSSVTNLTCLPIGYIADALGPRGALLASAAVTAALAAPFALGTRPSLEDHHDADAARVCGRRWSVAAVTSPLLCGSLLVSALVLPALAGLLLLAWMACPSLAAGRAAPTAPPAPRAAAADGRWLLRLFLAPTTCLAAAAAGAAVLLQSFYMATLREQLLWRAHGDAAAAGAHLDLFNWLSPSLTLPCLLLAAAWLVWGGLSVARPIWLQVPTVLVFIPLHFFSFSHMYACIGNWYPASSTGRVSGWCLSAGGAVSLAAAPQL